MESVLLVPNSTYITKKNVKIRRIALYNAGFFFLPDFITHFFGNNTSSFIQCQHEVKATGQVLRNSTQVRTDIGAQLTSRTLHLLCSVRFLLYIVIIDYLSTFSTCPLLH